MGLRPVTPQKAAGQVMEPHVSEPIAKETRPPATAEAAPDDEPPAQRERSHGVRQAPFSAASAQW